MELEFRLSTSVPGFEPANNLLLPTFIPNIPNPNDVMMEIDDDDPIIEGSSRKEENPTESIDNDNYEPIDFVDQKKRRR